jgi:hypothetical protein
MEPVLSGLPKDARYTPRGRKPMTTLDAANEALRNAVRERLDNTPSDDPKMTGYTSLAGCQPAQECAARVLADAWRDGSCCDGGKCQPKTVEWRDFLREEMQRGGNTRGPSAADVIERFNPTHPTSQAFFDLCDSLKAMHASKSSDYGSPDGKDPLANIRNGAAFVGIAAWQGAMVRLSDKVTRLATFNKTGSLTYEGVEDTLLDLASYSLLALLLYREEQ